MNAMPSFFCQIISLHYFLLLFEVHFHVATSDNLQSRFCWVHLDVLRWTEEKMHLLLSRHSKNVKLHCISKSVYQSFHNAFDHHCHHDMFKKEATKLKTCGQILFKSFQHWNLLLLSIHICVSIQVTYAYTIHRLHQNLKELKDDSDGHTASLLPRLHFWRCVQRCIVSRLYLGMRWMKKIVTTTTKKITLAVLLEWNDLGSSMVTEHNQGFLVLHVFSFLFFICSILLHRVRRFPSMKLHCTIQLHLLLQNNLFCDGICEFTYTFSLPLHFYTMHSVMIVHIRIAMRYFSYG